ncbi:hypothetical protein [Aquisediminimonas profunda]|uniref:hypothetical protein n=1 Tax=Aquisediminimonas profunda TaxID=1550733 RepID=UPI001C6289B7|nr:hypothetical protein [Aquisediminimonas profunda]
MKNIFLFSLNAMGLIISSSATGQTNQPPTLIAQVAQPNQIVLPANTEISLIVNNEITSKKSREGETFSLTVAQNVMLSGYVIIPKGARATGEITWITHKGAFGKSGKMDIELRHIDVGGMRVPIEGKYRQEGEGNTVATVGAVVAVGIFGALVTGRTAVIPSGRELIAHTKEDLPVQLPGAPVTMAAAPVYNSPMPTAVAPVAYSATSVTAIAPSASYGDEIALIPAKTASGYCIRAAADYRGTGSKSRPTVTSAMPRC